MSKSLRTHCLPISGLIVLTKLVTFSFENFLLICTPMPVRSVVLLLSMYRIDKIREQRIMSFPGKKTTYLSVFNLGCAFSEPESAVVLPLFFSATDFVAEDKWWFWCFIEKNSSIRWHNKCSRVPFFPRKLNGFSGKAAAFKWSTDQHIYKSHPDATNSELSTYSKLKMYHCLAHSPAAAILFIILLAVVLSTLQVVRRLPPNFCFESNGLQKPSRKSQ